MTSNVGLYDRALRVLVGFALIGYAMYGEPSALTTAAWIGVVPLVTGLVGWCPLYRLLGIGEDGHKTT